VTAFVLGLALLFGPPSPVLHSQGDHVTAGRGSYCWAGDSGTNGLQPYICADTFKPPPLSKRALAVGLGGRVRVDMRTDTDSLTATLRGRKGDLAVEAVGGSKRRFLIRLPRRLSEDAALDLHADYPRGDGSFGARLRAPPPPAPPKPLLREGKERLTMARGSYCWSTPPVGLCVDTLPPVTEDALAVRRGDDVLVDMRIATDVVAATIRGRGGKLSATPLPGSHRRFIVDLPRRLKQHAILELFARYPQGDSSFGARLSVR
jgi:hypothetical protein